MDTFFGLHLSSSKFGIFLPDLRYNRFQTLETALLSNSMAEIDHNACAARPTYDFKFE